MLGELGNGTDAIIVATEKSATQSTLTVRIIQAEEEFQFTVHTSIADFTNQLINSEIFTIRDNGDYVFSSINASTSLNEIERLN